jgi:hypothetical protein
MAINPNDNRVFDAQVVFVPDPLAFRDSYNRERFYFAHSVHENPLFALDHLAELVCREPELTKSAYCSSADVKVTDSWATGLQAPQTLRHVLNGIATNNSLILLRHVERSAILGPVLHALIDHVVALVGPALRSDVIESRATLLIASPRRVTSYHMDSNTNFLFQLYGDKRLTVFDRAVVTAEELERYYGGDLSAAKYNAERQGDAEVFELHAGSAVHVPSLAPHWAQNLDSVSIALSINFDLRSIERAGRIYRLNGRLRRLGLSPQAPGYSQWRDEIKLGMSTIKLGMNSINHSMSRWARPLEAPADRKYH